MTRLHPLTASLRWLWREHATPLILIACAVLVFGLGCGLRACTEPTETDPPYADEVQTTRDRTDAADSSAGAALDPLDSLTRDALDSLRTPVPLPPRDDPWRDADCFANPADC